MPTTNITDLHSHPAGGNYVYRESADLSPWLRGKTITITGGTNWNPGTYTITNVSEGDFSSGHRTFYQLNGNAASAGDVGGGQATIPTSDLTFVAPCGYAALSTVSGNLVVNIVGANITCSQTLTRQWHYTTMDAPDTYTLIAGQTGVNLVDWQIPPALIGAFFIVSQSVFAAGDAGSIERIGNSTYLGYYNTNGVGTSYQLTGVGVYGGTLPAPPTDASLGSAWDINATLTQGRQVTVVGVGDSLTNGYLIPQSRTLLQNAPEAAAYGTRIKHINTGHAGSYTTDWSPTAPASGNGQGYLESVAQSGKNNYTVARDAVLAAKAAGDVVVVSACLGTNDLGQTASPQTTAYTNCLDGLRAAGADVIVSHDLYVQLGERVGVIHDMVLSWPAFLDTLAASQSAYHKRGQRKGGADYYQFPTETDRTHATTSHLQDILTRRYLAANLAAIASVFPPLLIAISVTLDAPNENGEVQAHAAPSPSGAMLTGLVWSRTDGGAIASNGLFTLPAKTRFAQAVGVMAKSGDVSGFSVVAIDGTVAVVEKYVRGPLNAEFQYADETCGVGDLFAVDIALTDGSGTRVPLGDDAPVSVTVTANGTILTEDEPAAIVYGIGGIVRYQMQNADTENAGRKMISVTVGAGASKQTFGPCYLAVKAK